jgi:flagellar hook-associated protein 2
MDVKAYIYFKEEYNMVMFTNQTRFTGFSGIDVESLVRQMMTAESARLNRMRQDRTLFSWRQQNYVGVASRLRTFSDRFISAAGPDSIRMSTNMNSRAATITGVGGGPTAARVTATPNAAVGIHNVRVESVATRHRATLEMDPSATDIRAANVFDPDRIREGDSFRISLNGGTAFTVEFDAAAIARINADTGTDEENVVNEINRQLGERFGTVTPGGENRVSAGLEAVAGGYRLTFGTYRTTDNITITEGTAPSEVSGTGFNGTLANLQSLVGQHMRLSVGDNDVHFTFNFTEPADWDDLTADEQEEALQTAFNNALNASGRLPGGVRASFDDTTGELLLTSTGRTANVNITLATLTEAGATGNPVNTIINDVVVRESSTLTMMGGIRHGDQNTFNVNNRIGDIFTNVSFDHDSDGPINTSFDVGTGQVELRANMTVQQMINAVNSANVGVRMSFDNLNNTFTMESTQFGASNTRDFGIFTESVANGGFGFGEVAGSGTDAIITINNGPAIHRDGNTFSINGMNFDLNHLTADSINAGTPYEFRVEVTQNTARVRETIDSFVAEYNRLVEELQELRLTSRPTSGGRFYDPLTDEQRREMSDREIEDWESRAQEGLLHRSQILERALRDMRRAINEAGVADVVEGTGPANTLRMSHLGIQTNREGFLVVDSERLSNALENFESNDVARLFLDAGDRINLAINGGMTFNADNTSRNHVGALQRINQEAGSPTNLRSRIDLRMQDLERRAEREEERLARREQQLFAQFGRMESAVMQSSAQMDFLFMMMGF